MNKRVLLILLPITIAMALLIGIYQGLKPSIQSWLLMQVNRVSGEKLPVHLRIGNVEWSLLFPEVILENVDVKPKDFPIPPVHIKKITASLDLLALAGGQIAISSVLLEQPEADIDLDLYLKDSGEKEKPLPMNDLFQALKKIPVARLGFERARLQLSSNQMKWKLNLNSADLLLNFRKDRLGLQMDLNDSIFQYAGSDEIPFRLQGEAQMTASVLDISNLKLGVLNSVVSLKGSLVDLPQLLISPKGVLEFEGYSELEPLSEVAQNLFRFPELVGKIQTSGRLDFTSKDHMTAGFKFSARQFKVSHFELGDVQFQGELKDNTFQIPKLALTNEAGLVDVNALQVRFDPKTWKSVEVQAQVETEQVDLHELMIRLGIGNIPVEIFIGAKLKCAGPVYPNANVRCDGQASGQQLEVGTEANYKSPLVQIEEFSAEGGFNVTAQDVTYQAHLKVGSDQGDSSGVIGFKSGFKIKFSTPRLDMKHIREIAGLKIEGTGELQGFTEGNSDRATFEINMKTQNLFFENFFLGSPSGQMAYQKGVLRFTNLEGSFPSTQYLANLDVDLHEKKLEVAGQLSKFEINELLSVFQRQFQVPVEMAGTGSATFHVSGPFALGKLSYDLNAQMVRGTAVGETFDKLELNLHSNSGEMTIQKALISKNKNVIQVTGGSHSNGDIDVKIEGRALPLEESENISKLGGQISGLLDVDTTLKGFVLKPEIQIGGRIYQLSVEEQEFADSAFALEFFQKSISGHAILIGGQLEAKFTLPMDEQSPFDLKLQAKDWNYTTLFALIGGGGLLGEYKAVLTGSLDLSSPRGGLWASSGKGTITDFLLQRGGLSLRNLAPMELSMTNGTASLQNFRLDGDQTFFEFKGSEISQNDLGIHIEGQANLRLFQIFLPFLEEFGGKAAISADLSGPLLKPEILGNANIRSGFAKLKGFPHPFEKVQADVQFSQSKVLINGFLGNIAGGTFEGDGNIAIEGIRNLPTRVSAHLEGVNFNVPDRVRTSGSADVVFSGNWFPFTLSGTYHVTDGFMDKELTEESNSLSLRQSSYLPKIILQSAFEPVLLDLHIILEKPLVIRNSLVDGAVNGLIQVRGAPTHPVLGGQLSAEKGTKAIFRDKIFEVQTANIRFTSPDEINPELYVSARSRISEHDIGMLIQGSAKNPVIKLSSVPPLSEADIISLIALGVTSEGLEKRQQEAQQARDSAAGGIAANVFTQLEPIRKLQKSTGVEIQFSNSFDDTRKVSIQKVTISKKLSDKVRAAATQTSSRALNSNEYTLQYNFTESISAIGRYEDRKPGENASSFENVVRENQSILGIDLEFKKEFK